MGEFTGGAVALKEDLKAATAAGATKDVATSNIKLTGTTKVGKSETHGELRVLNELLKNMHQLLQLWLSILMRV